MKDDTRPLVTSVKLPLFDTTQLFNSDDYEKTFCFYCYVCDDVAAGLPGHERE